VPGFPVGAALNGPPPTQRTFFPLVPMRHWEYAVASLLLAGWLLWAALAVLDPSAYDLGLALRGGEEAWKSGHPEILRTWMSTPFLAMVMAVVSRLFARPGAVQGLNAINLGLIVVLLASVWSTLRDRVASPFWWGSLGFAAFYSPLVSTVRFRQFNLVALALALGGFLAARRGRSTLGGFLAALSISIKPVLVLLPFALVARRETRRHGVWTCAWIAFLAVVAQVFLALRAHDPGPLSPWLGLHNFSSRTAPWIGHPENFSPQGLLSRLVGGQPQAFEAAVLGFGVLLLILMAHNVIKNHTALSWPLFSFVSLLSPMVSPIAWSHYQLFLAPMFLLLGYEFHRGRAGWVFWSALALAYVLAESVVRPLTSVPGAFVMLLTGREETRRDLLQVLAVSQFAQYLLLLTALVWFSRTATSDSRATRDRKSTRLNSSHRL